MHAFMASLLEGWRRRVTSRRRVWRLSVIRKVGRINVCSGFHNSHIPQFSRPAPRSAHQYYTKKKSTATKKWARANCLPSFRYTHTIPLHGVLSTGSRGSAARLGCHQCHRRIPPGRRRLGCQLRRQHQPSDNAGRDATFKKARSGAEAHRGLRHQQNIHQHHELQSIFTVVCVCVMDFTKLLRVTEAMNARTNTV